MLFTEAYNELSSYTLAHPDQSRFIHQHIVDAQTAQTASAEAKPIALVFALAGLYLAIEKGYSGRQVQRMHQELTAFKAELPAITLPADRGSVTVKEVLSQPPGRRRDDMIRQWCASVWEAYRHNRESIIGYLRLAGKEQSP